MVVALSKNVKRWLTHDGICGLRPFQILPKQIECKLYPLTLNYMNV
jgi:hypothetical protein